MVEPHQLLTRLFPFDYIKRGIRNICAAILYTPKGSFLHHFPLPDYVHKHVFTSHGICTV